MNLKEKEDARILRWYLGTKSELLDRCFKCRSGWVRISKDGKFVCDKCGHEIETVTSRIAATKQ